MGLAWIMCGTGTLLCVIGLYLLNRNMYEKNRSILLPVIVIIGGLVLIAMGTAKYFNLD